MKTYIIQSGDTLGGIATKFYGRDSSFIDIADIAEANGIENPNRIEVGQELKIPEKGEKVIKPVLFEITKEQLREMMPLAANSSLEKYLAPLNHQMSKGGVDTPLRIAHFIAQLAHESGSFKYDTENLNYGAGALKAVFGKYFKTQEMLDEYARQPEKIANVVYANRMGNGNAASGDGWRYRGRGLIQLTGQNNYEACGKGIGVDLIESPEVLSIDPEISVAAAVWYWNSRKLNQYADEDNIEKITRRINGGYHGLDDRKEFLARAKKALLSEEKEK